MMHIHGKRTERQNDTKAACKSRRRGRPRKLPEELTSVNKSIILDRLRKHHKTVKRKMDAEMDRLSALEKLPVELIQQIFFHALEVNMPRASNHLRQVLSTEQIFNALITFAYFDDDNQSPVESKHFLPAEYRILNLSEKVRLQRSIFSCRWCTYNRILACLPALSRLTMVQAWYQERTEDESHESSNDTGHTQSLIVSNEVLRSLAQLPDLVEERKLENHFLARTTIEDLGNSGSLTQRERAAPLPRIVTWTSSLDKDGNIHKSTDRCQTILAARHIPQRLIRGPSWTNEDLALLRLLRQGYTFIQDGHVMSISASAAFDGMRYAIRDQNATVLKVLLDMHNVFFKSGAWTIHSMMSTQLTPPSYHPLPIDLFHLAVEQGDNATELMSLLLRAGIDSLPQDDDAVTAWALHGSQAGNALAAWLLKHMEGTASYGLPRRVHLFNDGCISWRARPTGGSLFPEVSFAHELGYIPGTPIVPAGINGKPCGTEE